MNYKNSEVPVIFILDGEKFRIFSSKFNKWPKTRLSRIVKSQKKTEILKLCDKFTIDLDGIKMFTFNRNPLHFNTILDLYRTGEVHRVKHSCSMTTKEELKFWGIDELIMELCCNSTYCEDKKPREKINNEMRTWKKETSELIAAEENFGSTVKDHIRKKIWFLLEYPDSSTLARIYEAISVTVVVVSILSWVGEVFLQDVDSLKEFDKLQDVLSKINNYAMLFFTCEFTTRYVCSPNKKIFISNAFNMIDLVGIVLFIVTTAVVNIDMGNLGKTGRFVRMMRFLRILRFCKIIRHLTNFQCLLNVVYEAMVELQFIFIVMNITLIVNALLFFYAEKDDRNNREQPFSFLDSLEWTVSAITTVRKIKGAPNTHLGKFVGSFCVLCGIIIFALPVPVIVNSFSNAYKQQLCYKDILHRWQQAKKTKMANEFLGLKKIKSKLEDVSLSSNDESQEEIENYANYIKQWKEKCKGKKILITCNAPNEIFV